NVTKALTKGTYIVKISSGSSTSYTATFYSPQISSSPTITSSATASVAENQTSALTITASDLDGDVLTYSLSGTDAALFNINASTGVVTFKTAPDYETKSSYIFTATASDGTLSSSKDVTISILNVIAEFPAVLKNIAFSIAENQKSGFLYNDSLVVENGDTPITHILLSGSGSENFEATTDGEIKLKVTGELDYETNTSYKLQAVATNGYGQSNHVDVNISVIDHQIDTLIGVIDTDWQTSGYGGCVGTIVDKYGNTYFGTSKCNHDGEIDTDYNSTKTVRLALNGNIFSLNEKVLSKLSLKGVDEIVVQANFADQNMYSNILANTNDFLYAVGQDTQMPNSLRIEKYSASTLTKDDSFIFEAYDANNTIGTIYGISLDNLGNIYCAYKRDTGRYPIQLVKFNADGLQDTTFGAYPQGIEIESSSTIPIINLIYFDNKLYTIKKSEIKRLTMNALLDTSFGTNGILTFLSNQVLDMKIHNNQLYVLESSTTTSKVSRFSLNGALDITFAVNGILNLSQKSTSLIFNQDGDLFVIGDENIKLK
ncbi:MAG: cadherin domain-containing protein, partial [Campylobacterales bacterium]|nr:cadherin domain-containing protein [Campylobacterales bacterium]